MMTIVLPYKPNSHSDIEIRYMLRSVEKHLQGACEIFLLGRAPDWVQNVSVIHTPDIDRNFDKTYQKERAIYEKVRLACYLPDVTADFLFMNDDHFLLQDMEAKDFPLHWSGDLEKEAERPDLYGNAVRNTLEILKSCRASTFNFDTHCPIVYNKEAFLELEKIDWGRKWGYCIKSLYCNLHGLKGEMYNDMKFRVEYPYNEIVKLIAGRMYFSTDERRITRDMAQVFKELYPNKSQYEK